MKFKNKIALITGGTGSFGNAMTKLLLNQGINQVRIFSRDEKKQDDMRKLFDNDKIKFYIGDVRDFNSINPVCSDVDFIFHAAALKQVPSCEFFPIQAVKTNIFGTKNVIESAIFHNVKHVIIISTDKAVYPINAMGMSKALMQKIMIAYSRHAKNTILCGTRYGNVMYTRGSVIPLFIQQIKNNKQITITDGNMTRFLMSLDESIRLVLYAYQNGKSGEIFVQKSPACSIYNLVLALCKIFNSKCNIKIIGTRHGQKKHEVLISKQQMIRTINYDKYYKILPDSRSLNYNQYFDSGQELENVENYTSENTIQLSVDEIIKKLLELDQIKEQI